MTTISVYQNGFNQNSTGVDVYRQVIQNLGHSHCDDGFFCMLEFSNTYNEATEKSLLCHNYNASPNELYYFRIRAKKRLLAYKKGIVQKTFKDLQEHPYVKHINSQFYSVCRCLQFGDGWGEKCLLCIPKPKGYKNGTKVVIGKTALRVKLRNIEVASLTTMFFIDAYRPTIRSIDIDANKNLLLLNGGDWQLSII